MWIRVANSRKDKAGWLKAREEMVTGSDIGALFNVSQYKDRAGLLKEKITREESFDGNIYSRAGSALEDAVLHWAVEEYDDWYAAGACQDLLVDPSCRRLGATPDSLVVMRSPSGVRVINCQVKCTAKGAKGMLNNGLPLEWQYQMQAEMAVLGDWCTRSCLLAFHRAAMEWHAKEIQEDQVILRRYYLDRDQELIDKIRSSINSFWTHVDAGREKRKRIDDDEENDNF